MSKSSISDEMKELVSAFLTSGQSQKEFAESHGLSKGKLHYWVKKFSEALNPKSSKLKLPTNRSIKRTSLSASIEASRETGKREVCDRLLPSINFIS